MANYVLLCFKYASNRFEVHQGSAKIQPRQHQLQIRLTQSRLPIRRVQKRRVMCVYRRKWKYCSFNMFSLLACMIMQTQISKSLILSKSYSMPLGYFQVPSTNIKKFDSLKTDTLAIKTTVTNLTSPSLPSLRLQFSISVCVWL